MNLIASAPRSTSGKNMHASAPRSPSTAATLLITPPELLNANRAKEKVANPGIPSATAISENSILLS
jgi:hypothetical protein